MNIFLKGFDINKLKCDFILVLANQKITDSKNVLSPIGNSFIFSIFKCFRPWCHTMTSTFLTSEVSIYKPIYTWLVPGRGSLTKYNVFYKLHSDTRTLSKSKYK